jgi:molecular chaperone GrpE
MNRVPTGPADPEMAGFPDDPAQQAIGEALASDLTGLLKKAESEVAELRDAWLRARADAENIRKQAATDLAKAHKFAVEKFAADLLPVRDALEQALVDTAGTPEQLRAGVELTLKQLDAAFGRAQVEVIDPAGEKFDPHRHQAIQMVESAAPANTVVDVLQKGYLLNDRVLRPAMVTVARGDGAAGPAPSA